MHPDDGMDEAREEGAVATTTPLGEAGGGEEGVGMDLREEPRLPQVEERAEEMVEAAEDVPQQERELRDADENVRPARALNQLRREPRIERTEAVDFSQEIAKKVSEPVFFCPKHGDVGATAFSIEIYSPKRITKSYCMLCFMEFMDKNVTELKRFESKKDFEFYLHKEKMVNGDSKEGK